VTRGIHIECRAKGFAMPQVNAAPSPSPVVAPPASANAASPAAGTGAAAANDGAPAQPFAAVLQHQVNQQTPGKQADDKADAAAIKRLAALAGADTAIEQPTADALAAIAQMLPGIAAPKTAPQADQAEFSGTGQKGKSTTADDDGSDAVALAAPLMAGNMPPPAPQETAGEAAPAAKPIAANMASDGAENLAADVQAAASRAAPAKQEASDFASLLAAAPHAGTAQPNAHAASAAETASHSVQTPVGAQDWSNEVGEKLTWMVGKHETRADLVLNPPELGRIEVSITMKGDEASATFVSANPTVRDAIENAVPRLREVLQDAGISLGQTQVGAETFQQQQPAPNREKGDNSWRSGNSGTADSDSVRGMPGAGATAAIRRGNGLVDTFA
jgi:flagellar hook-length control protein FliK